MDRPKESCLPSSGDGGQQRDFSSPFGLVPVLVLSPHELTVPQEQLSCAELWALHEITDNNRPGSGYQPRQSGANQAKHCCGLHFVLPSPRRDPGQRRQNAKRHEGDYADNGNPDWLRATDGWPVTATAQRAALPARVIVAQPDLERESRSHEQRGEDKSDGKRYHQPEQPLP
jgi:hypothetical protein